MEKKLKLIIIPVIVIVLFPGNILCQKPTRYDKKKKKEEERDRGYEEMKKLAHTGLYYFTGHRAHPLGDSPVDLTTQYNYLRVKHYDVEAYLPFFGRSYKAPDNGRPGIDISGKLKNIVITERDSKRRVIIEFEIREASENFDILIEIEPGGTARLSLNSGRRSSIRYDGIIEAFEPDEEKKFP